MEDKSFVFYETWAQSLFDLANDSETQKDALDFALAIAEYGLYGTMPEDLSTIVRSNMRTVMLGMDNAKKRRVKNKEDGSTGGRPKGDRTEAFALMDQGWKNVDIQNKLGIPKSTMTRIRKEYNIEKAQNTFESNGNEGSKEVQNSEGSKVPDWSKMF